MLNWLKKLTESPQNLESKTKTKPPWWWYRKYEGGERVIVVRRIPIEDENNRDVYGYIEVGTCGYIVPHTVAKPASIMAFGITSESAVVMNIEFDNGTGVTAIPEYYVERIDD